MSRVVIVTGGSRGIGRACAVQAAKRGWSVLLTYHSRSDEAKKVVEEIDALGGKVLALKADISDTSTAAKVVEAAATLGTIHGLINNAGILDAPSSFADIDDARWARIFQTNTAGAFAMARETVRAMRDGGAIVNMSSMAAPLGAPNEFIDYAASKGAIESMTIGMAKELGPKGIRVNAIRPGLIDTDIHEADRLERLMTSVPLGRAGTSDEVAMAACWLLSEEASYVTGAILPVSGGR